MADLTKLDPEIFQMAATVLRGAADQADEFGQVARDAGHAGDPLGFGRAGAGLRRIAKHLEEQA